jgi:hypothetical protein
MFYSDDARHARGRRQKEIYAIRPRRTQKRPSCLGRIGTTSEELKPEDAEKVVGGEIVVTKPT